MGEVHLGEDGHLLQLLVISIYLYVAHCLHALKLHGWLGHGKSGQQRHTICGLYPTDLKA